VVVCVWVLVFVAVEVEVEVEVEVDVSVEVSVRVEVCVLVEVVCVDVDVRVARLRDGLGVGPPAQEAIRRTSIETTTIRYPTAGRAWTWKRIGVPPSYPPFGVGEDSGRASRRPGGDRPLARADASWRLGCAPTGER
jgi:hypothetical protein